MRLTIYILAIMSFIVAKAEQNRSSQIINSGVEIPRSEVLSYDIEGYFDRRDKMSTKYIKPLREWQKIDDNTLETVVIKPFAWLGRQVYLRVIGASAPYSVLLNGKQIAKVSNGASLSEFDITRIAKEGRNSLRIVFDSGDGMNNIEGWRKADTELKLGEAYVVSQPTQMVRDIFVQSHVEGEKLVSQIGVVVKSHALNPRTSNISISLQSESNAVIAHSNQTLTQSMRGEDTLYLNTITPIEEAWSFKNPTMKLLKINVQYEGRYQEYQTHNIALRALSLAESGELLVNDKAVKLKAKRVAPEYNPMELYKLKDSGYNCIVVSAATLNRELLKECDREGIYVILTAPINTSASGEGIAKGGNISNNPAWRDAFVERATATYYTTQLHPSVIGYAMAESSENGYNLYESYLELKNITDSRPILYFDAEGEWNSDNVAIEIE